MQIVPEWPLVTCKYSTRVAAKPIACKFPSILFMLHATGGHNLPETGGHSGTNYMWLAASRMQILHALAASCIQSRQFFASTLREQLFELVNKEAIKNLRIYSTRVLAKAYPKKAWPDPISWDSSFNLTCLNSLYIVLISCLVNFVVLNNYQNKFTRNFVK